MSFQITNLFARLPSDETEQVLPLLETPAFRLEHIVSNGQASTSGFWYDQPDPEWILLLCGQAALDFENGGLREIKAGDCLLIPAHSKHRVETVSEDAVWLALHFKKVQAE